MTRRMLDIVDVSQANMCTGCGMCAYMAPESLKMTDRIAEGRRPILLEGAKKSETASALKACPGAHVTSPARHVNAEPSLFPGWGNVLKLWEGWAADDEIRFAGSSGGAATALALFAMERRGFVGTLHTAARTDLPYMNAAVMSHDRSGLLRGAGSRYAPASPCEGLDLAVATDGPIVMIGKPCDVAAVDMATRLQPTLQKRIQLTIAVFCAGTPTTRGTLEMLEAMGVQELGTLRSVRYRGNGWPGSATAVFDAGNGLESRELNYNESWNRILQRHRQWRCRLCMDHTGELADISVGDPWYRPIEPGDAGRSLILARTSRGLQLIEAAIASGYLVADIVEPGVLPASQPNLLKARGDVAGRILTLRVIRKAAPKFTGFAHWRFWWANLSIRDKARSIVGTIRRSRLQEHSRLRARVTDTATEASPQSFPRDREWTRGTIDGDE